MPARRPDEASERPLDELVQTVSERAVVLAREEVDLARQEMTAKAREAAAGSAMLGGAALLGVLAAGTGTAALVLLLSRRPGRGARATGDRAPACRRPTRSRGGGRKPQGERRIDQEEASQVRA